MLIVFFGTAGHAWPIVALSSAFQTKTPTHPCTGNWPTGLALTRCCRHTRATLHESCILHGCSGKNSEAMQDAAAQHDRHSTNHEASNHKTTMAHRSWHHQQCGRTRRHTRMRMRPRLWNNQCGLRWMHVNTFRISLTTHDQARSTSMRCMHNAPPGCFSSVPMPPPPHLLLLLPTAFAAAQSFGKKTTSAQMLWSPRAPSPAAA